MSAPAAGHRQKVLNHIFGPLKKHLDVDEPESRSVLEQALYAVCREGTSRAKADQAFKSLQKAFFDWNELRVSSPREVQEALAGLPKSEMRAQRLIALLQEIFASTFAYDLETLQKKGLKQAEKQLERLQGVNPYVAAYTLQTALDGHVMPIDEDMLRTLRRLELLDEEADPASAHASLEHLVPKARGPIFCEMVSELAQEYCHEKSPRCAPCPMRELCPTGQKNLRRAKPTAARQSARSR